MARPRVFISSTFYDLRHVRADLEAFIKDMGYEPVLNERGTIPYDKDSRLEEACLREVQNCDITVHIIGGRFGSASKNEPYSISQNELKTAVKSGRQVFIFIEKGVFNEFNTYKRNKGVKIDWNYVDDPKVYAFIEEISALPSNNATQPFESTQEIVDYLREQWAGLFQRFLQAASRQKEVDTIEGLERAAKTLDEMVRYLRAENAQKDAAIGQIILANHPIFDTIRKLTNVPYRVFFTTHEEMAQWLTARGFSPLAKEHWDDKNVEEWVLTNEKKRLEFWLRVNTGLFDAEGNLVPMTAAKWREDLVRYERVELPPVDDDAPPQLPDDDLPF